MINDNTTKIEKFFSREYREIAKDIIYQDDGRYHLFEQYQIEKTKTNDYAISMRTTATEKTFYKLKNAVAWCVFDRQNLIIQSQRIQWLDDKLSGIEVSLQLHEKLYKKSKRNEDRLIYLAKLNEDKIKKTNIIRELQGFISTSDRLLTDRFNKTLDK